MTHHFFEKSFPQQQLIWCTFLHDRTFVHHYDFIVVSHGVEAVGDGDDRGVLELLPDALLDEVVRLHVHVRCRLVHYQETVPPQQRPAQAQKLPLPHGKYLGHVGDVLFQLARKLHKHRSTSSILGFSPACSTAAHSSASDFYWKGSRLDLTVPLNRKGVWGMTDRFRRSVCSPMASALCLSISYTDFSSGSTILKMAWMSDDFPAPVLPTIPTLSPSLMFREISFKMRGSSGRYLILKDLKEISAFSG
jgi:hypothetical protein